MFQLTQVYELKFRRGNYVKTCQVPYWQVNEVIAEARKILRRKKIVIEVWPQWSHEGSLPVKEEKKICFKDSF